MEMTRRAVLKAMAGMAASAVLATRLPFALRPILAGYPTLPWIRPEWDPCLTEQGLSLQDVRAAMPRIRDGQRAELSRVRLPAQLTPWREEQAFIQDPSGLTAWELLNGLPGLVVGTTEFPQHSPCVKALSGPAGTEERWDNGVKYFLIFEVATKTGVNILVEVEPRCNARICRLNSTVREIRLYDPAGERLLLRLKIN